MSSAKASVLALVMVASLLMVSSVSWAQSPAPKVEFGLRAGANFSDINTSDFQSSKRSGLVGGVYADFATILLHLQAEALLSQHGFKGGTPLSSYTGNSELEYRDTVLQIPALVVLALPTPMVSPRAYLGPALNIPLKSEMKLDNDWVDIKDDTKSSWSMVFGVGVKIFRVGVDLRYSLGLTAFNDRPVGQILDDAFDEISGVDQYNDVKDHTLSITASIALN
ncbi:MAG TPA: porin family protein [Candidatus Krumholzibacteria bacterium]|nr:porin family protein [Candidatus Krumholzibacteria bacterium]